MVLLLGVGDLEGAVSVHTGRGCTAVVRGAGFTVCVTTVVVQTVVDCATLVRKAGVGVSVAGLSGVGAAEVDVSSGPGVMEIGVGGGAGAFLFLCWLSEPRPIQEAPSVTEQ